MLNFKQMADVGKTYPMNGGSGPNSYSSRSNSQREFINIAKKSVTEAIVEKLDIQKSSPSTTVRVADLGCADGPNTFIAVRNIVEAIELKCQNQGLQSSRIPEFQVFFNDYSSNDFNRLFSSLPPDRRYHAAGVPGSFFSRLFPSHSLHIFHASFTINWLSEVPKKVVDRSSPAWNGGRIHYTGGPDAVAEAYSDQWEEDMARFLQLRAEEIADGGLMILIFPARPDGIPHSQVNLNLMHDVLGSCLIDMAKKGIVSEEKVDMFNTRVYFMSAQELEASVERNGCFSIERMDTLPPVTSPEASATSTGLRAKAASSALRSGMEGLVKEHFGEEIMDQLFDAFAKKLEHEFSPIASGKLIHFCAVLKRKPINQRVDL